MILPRHVLNLAEPSHPLLSLTFRIVIACLEYRWRRDPARFRLDSNRQWYRLVYIRSAHWQRVRLRTLRRAGHCCQACGRSGVALDVHHLAYDRLGFEAPSDVEALCRGCHEGEHQ